MITTNVKVKGSTNGISNKYSIRGSTNGISNKYSINSYYSIGNHTQRRFQSDYKLLT